MKKANNEKRICAECSTFITKYEYEAYHGHCGNCDDDFKEEQLNEISDELYDE